MQWFRKRWKSTRRLFRSKKRSLRETSRPSWMRRLFRFLFGWRWLRRLFRMIRRLFKSKPFTAPVRYWRTRNWKRLVCGIPAFLALIGVATAGAALARQNPNELARWYSGCARESALAKDSKAALGYTEMAVRLRAEPGELMNLAELSLQNGDAARALAILESLAPSDGRGYARAHLKLATISKDSISAAEKHLLRIVDEEGEIGSTAIAYLGELYAITGRPKQAIPLLQRTPHQSRYRVLLAEVASVDGDMVTANIEAKICREAYEAKLLADPTDMNSRLLVARCLLVLKQYPAAIDLLNAGISLAPSAEFAGALSQRRSKVYVEWLEAVEKDTKTSPGARFAVIEMAINATPNDSRLLLRLLDFADPKSETGAAARKLLKSQLADGRNIGLAHFVLGTYAWLEKDPVTAGTHLDQAQKVIPHFPELANNLAWVLANSDPPDLKRALEMIDGALAQIPKHRQFLHTRGNILIKMERWRDAIHDLEIALSGGAHPDRDGIHAGLAKAYESLGNKSMAEIHRAKAGSKAEKK